MLKIGEFHEPNRKLVGRTVWHYDHVESTNETAKELLEEDLEEGLVLWADRQSAGRGRQGRAWASPPGGLYFSVILRPKETHAWILGLLVGMPVVKALRDYGRQYATTGKRVTATTSTVSSTGRAYDIAPNGALIIMDEENTKHEFVEGSLKVVP